MSAKLTDITHGVEIDAPPAVVWTVLTDAASVPQWLGCMQYTGIPGSTFYMQQDRAKHAAGDISGATHCDIEEIRSPELFRFSWYMPGTPKTMVTIVLKALGANRTRATLTHAGWDQFPAEMVKGIRDMLDGGWSSYVLPNLKLAAETAAK
ncbi:hypothetical protein BWI17_06645 [Betaproteobacteria bacterium GR16-43]|nr:hypothetical protein BWI17_06645 [Betaproteobacteria bacterium GR16-43]